MRGKHLSHRNRRTSKQDILRYTRILSARVSDMAVENKRLRTMIAKLREENERLKIICEMKGVSKVA